MIVGEICIRRDGDRFLATLALVPGSPVARCHLVYGQGNNAPWISGQGPTLDAAKDDLMKNLGLATFYTMCETETADEARKR